MVKFEKNIILQFSRHHSVFIQNFQLLSLVVVVVVVVVYFKAIFNC